MVDNKYLQKFIDKCGGDRFAATMLVARLARNLANRYNNLILHSEALTWVLTGERPSILDDNGNLNKSLVKTKISYMDDLLCMVDDEEICKCVRSSISKSNTSQNLVYLYNEITDEPRRARIRVLCRMIWYQTHKYK